METFSKTTLHVTLTLSLISLFMPSMAPLQAAEETLVQTQAKIQQLSKSGKVLSLSLSKNLPQNSLPKAGKPVLIHLNGKKAIAIKVLKSSSKRVIGQIIRTYQKTPLKEGDLAELRYKGFPPSAAPASKDPFQDSFGFEDAESKKEEEDLEKDKDFDDLRPNREISLGYLTEPKGVFGSFGMKLHKRIFAELGLGRASEKGGNLYPFQLNGRAVFDFGSLSFQPLLGFRYVTSVGAESALKDETGFKILYGASLQYPSVATLRLRTDYWADTDHQGVFIGIVIGRD